MAAIRRASSSATRSGSITCRAARSECRSRDWRPLRRRWRNNGINDGASLLDPPPVAPNRAISAERAYLLILFSAFSFAVMTTCGHAVGERADWRVTAVVRAALVFLFTWMIARRLGTQLVVWGPPTLWMRSIA